jgi:hypothetical protein
MLLVVGIGGRDAGKQVLVAFAGQEIAVVQRLLAEIGEQRIAAGVGLDGEAAIVDGLGFTLRRSGGGNGAGHGPCGHRIDEVLRALVLAGHGDSTLCLRGCGLGRIGSRAFETHRSVIPSPEIHHAPQSPTIAPNSG